MYGLGGVCTVVFLNVLPLAMHLGKFLLSHTAEATEKFLKVFHSCHYLHLCLQSVSILSRNEVYNDKRSSTSVKNGPLHSEHFILMNLLYLQ